MSGHASTKSGGALRTIVGWLFVLGLVFWMSKNPDTAANTFSVIFKAIFQIIGAVLNSFGKELGK